MPSFFKMKYICLLFLQIAEKFINFQLISDLNLKNKNVERDALLCHLRYYNCRALGFLNSQHNESASNVSIEIGAYIFLSTKKNKKKTRKNNFSQKLQCGRWFCKMGLCTSSRGHGGFQMGHSCRMLV